MKVKRKGLPIWDWIPNRIGDVILSVRPRMMLMTAIAAMGVLLAIGTSRIVVDNDSRNFSLATYNATRRQILESVSWWHKQPLYYG